MVCADLSPNFKLDLRGIGVGSKMTPLKKDSVVHTPTSARVADVGCGANKEERREPEVKGFVAPSPRPARATHPPSKSPCGTGLPSTSTIPFSYQGKTTVYN